MKTKTNISLKTIYSILSVIWGMIIAGGVILIFIFAYSFIFAKEAIPLIPDIIIRFNSETLVISNQLPKDFFITNSSASLGILNPSTALNIYSFLHTLIIILAFGYIVFVTRKIILSVIDGNPFIKINGLRIRAIGIILIVVPFLLNLISRVFLSSLILEKLVTVSSITDNLDSVIYPSIIFGLLFIVISEVFRIGTDIKKETDLTV